MSIPIRWCDRAIPISTWSCHTTCVMWIPIDDAIAPHQFPHRITRHVPCEFPSMMRSHHINFHIASHDMHHVNFHRWCDRIMSIPTTRHVSCEFPSMVRSHHMNFHRSTHDRAIPISIDDAIVPCQSPCNRTMRSYHGNPHRWCDAHHVNLHRWCDCNGTIRCGAMRLPMFIYNCIYLCIFRDSAKCGTAGAIALTTGVQLGAPAASVQCAVINQDGLACLYRTSCSECVTDVVTCSKPINGRASAAGNNCNAHRPGGVGGDLLPAACGCRTPLPC